MERFPTHLIPTTYSFTDKTVDKFVSENESIKTRPVNIGFSKINVSFELSETDYLDFLDFYNINLNNGIDNFETDWEIEGVFEEYSFSEVLNIRQISEEVYSVDTVLVKKFSYCDSLTLDSLDCMSTIEKTLIGINSYYETTVSCDYTTLSILDCVERIEKSLRLVK